ncbi:MAG: hypothetical protein Q9166_008176 [cf. Caloplaca sp. 2 TL-2023]
MAITFTRYWNLSVDQLKAFCLDRLAETGREHFFFWIVELRFRREAARLMLSAAVLQQPAVRDEATSQDVKHCGEVTDNLNYTGDEEEAEAEESIGRLDEDTETRKAEERSASSEDAKPQRTEAGV